MCPLEVQWVHLRKDNICNEVHLIARRNPVDLMTQLSEFSTWLWETQLKPCIIPYEF